MNRLATSSVAPRSPAPRDVQGVGPRDVRSFGRARPSIAPRWSGDLRWNDDGRWSDDRRWSDDGVVAALAITAAAGVMAVVMAIAASLAMAGATAAEGAPVASPLVRVGETGAGGAASTQVRATRVFVRPGDSLWSIALRVAPDEDPRRVMLRLDRARGRSGPLQAGEAIPIATSR